MVKIKSIKGLLVVNNSMWQMATMLNNVILGTDYILLSTGLTSYLLCDFCDMTTSLKQLWLVYTAGLIV